MALVLFHTEKVRKALKAPARAGIELFVLAGMAAVVGGLVMMARQAAGPMREQVHISLSIAALPKYTFLSLMRGFAAYVLSLTFTLIYGTIAAHNRRAERVMIPALDVLQAIPVLGFLPGLVLALVRLFPNSEVGLELSCIIMIFTAQVWNMTFSFHGSLRAIPSTLREAAAIQRLSGWQIFRLLEVPASMIGLVWNSMMSMAGGWFFLTVNEAFTLKDHDYRLPGIGSYMNEAINQGNKTAIAAAIIAMVIMIIAVDQLFWRPIVVWAQRFKLEDSAASDEPHSWVVTLFQKSRLLKWGKMVLRRRHGATIARAKLAQLKQENWVVAAAKILLPTLKWTVLAALGIALASGGCAVIRLLIALPVHTANHEDWVGVILALLASFLRTSAATLIGAAWALPAGILIGLSPKWSHRLQPVVQVVASFPAPMVFPLVTMALFMLHIRFTFGCVALMLLGAQWYILFNVIAGASAIPAELKEAAEVYHMSRWTRWKKLYLPSVFPYLVTGLVTAAGGAWNATIVSEYLQLRGKDPIVAFGLGSMISIATAAGNFPLLAASVIVMALFVVLLNRVLWKRLYRVSESRYSLNV